MGTNLSSRLIHVLAVALISMTTVRIAAQSPRSVKVFMLTDLEGVDGIVDKQLQCIPFKSPRWEESVKLLTGEINAAVDGLLEGGATEVVIVDSHGSGTNLSVLDIHPKARLLTGLVRSPTLELDASYKAVVFIGQHAMGGIDRAILGHTYGEDIQGITVNNIAVGEIGARLMLAATLGVPTIMLSGDTAACREIHGLEPKAECAEVKDGVSRTSGFMLPHSAACRLIREKARRALERLPEFRPYRIVGPVEVRVQFATGTSSTFRPRARVESPGVERLDDRTWVFRGNDLVDAWLKYAEF